MILKTPEMKLSMFKEAMHLTAVILLLGVAVCIRTCGG